jgi:hypothetical protein
LRYSYGMSDEILQEINRTIEAGFIVMAAQAIQARDSKKTFEQCRGEAFVQMRDTLASLARGGEQDT